VAKSNLESTILILDREDESEREILISKYDGGNKEDILKLHRNTYFRIYGRGDSYLQSVKSLEEQLRVNNAYVASKSDGEIIGFSAYVWAHEAEAYRKDIRRVLGTLKDLETVDWAPIYLQNYFKQEQRRIGKGKVVVQHFLNDFTRKVIEMDSPEDLIYYKDLIVTDYAIHPDFKKEKIDQELVSGLLSFAKKQDARTAYIRSYNIDTARKFRQLDFYPILRTGPMTETGRFILTMGAFMNNS